MLKAIDVARYLCLEYQKISGEKIDEMKLHKLLYFSQRECIAITGKPMFKDAFEGWKYGPVCPDVRQHFYDGEIVDGGGQSIDQASAYIVYNIILQYGKLASWALSEISHQETSWLNSRKGVAPGANSSTQLLLEDIYADAEKVRPYDSVWDMYIDEFDDLEESV